MAQGTPFRRNLIEDGDLQRRTSDDFGIDPRLIGSRRHFEKLERTIGRHPDLQLLEYIVARLLLLFKVAKTAEELHVDSNALRDRSHELPPGSEV
jgi:hypothetical protein